MISYTDELYHHGIKGQKWGVRRYRNEDGSLTEAGKKRLKKQQKRFYESASAVSKHHYTSNIQNHDALLRKSISGKQKSNLTYLRKKFYDGVQACGEADDKLQEIAGRNLHKYLPKDFDPEDNSKTAEYFVVEAEDRAYAQAKKDNPDLAKIVNNNNKAWNDYYYSLLATADELLGDYRDKPLSETRNLTSRNDVADQIDNMIRNNWVSAFYDQALRRR